MRGFSGQGSSGQDPGVQGSAILLMMAMLVMIISGILLNDLDQDRSRSRLLSNHAQRLGEAQQALLAYSVTHHRSAAYGAGLGTLPCPDMDFSGDGRSDSPCHSKEGVMVGWLPWRDLGVPPLYTMQGRSLWYAVSSSILPMTTQPIHALNVEGVQGINNHSVAVVFVPGYPLLAQKGGPILLSQATLKDAHLLPITYADLSATSGSGR